MNYQPRYNQFDKFINEFQCYANILLDQRSYYSKSLLLSYYPSSYYPKSYYPNSATISWIVELTPT